MLEREQNFDMNSLRIVVVPRSEEKNNVGIPYETGQEFRATSELPPSKFPFDHLSKLENEDASLWPMHDTPHPTPPAGTILSQNTSLSPERDAQLTAQAMQNVESFVAQLRRDAAGVAARFADIALLSGIAGSAIAPAVADGADGVEWLALHGGEQLAEWAQSQTPASADADFALTLATHLDKYIRGRAKTDAGTLTVEGAHPKIGEEVVRLLQLLHVFLMVEEALVQASQQERIALLRLFRQELSKLIQQQPQNAYMYDYTFQEIARQSFSLALDVERRNSPVIGALTDLRTEMKALRERPVSVVEVHTGGGAFVAGDVNVASGDFVGRDIRVTSRC